MTFAASNAPFPVPESYMISWSKELKRRQTDKATQSELLWHDQLLRFKFGYVRHTIPSRIYVSSTNERYNIYGYGNNNHHSLSELV